jgi:hypothetical protein
LKFIDYEIRVYGKPEIPMITNAKTNFSLLIVCPPGVSPGAEPTGIISIRR